jgi:hypothetical protein
MKKVVLYFKEAFWAIGLFVLSFPVLADLPKPPDKDIANSSNDWADVGGTLVFKVIGYACYALGALILVGVASTILKAYYTAHEKQDLGHFFKMLIVGLIAAAIGIGLVYSGYQIIPSQS